MKRNFRMFIILLVSILALSLSINSVQAEGNINKLTVIPNNDCSISLEYEINNLNEVNNLLEYISYGTNSWSCEGICTLYDVRSWATVESLPGELICYNNNKNTLIFTHVQVGVFIHQDKKSTLYTIFNYEKPANFTCDGSGILKIDGFSLHNSCSSILYPFDKYWWNIVLKPNIDPTWISIETDIPKDRLYIIKHIIDLEEFENIEKEEVFLDGIKQGDGNRKISIEVKEELSDTQFVEILITKKRQFYSLDNILFYLLIIFLILLWINFKKEGFLTMIIGAMVGVMGVINHLFGTRPSGITLVDIVLILLIGTILLKVMILSLEWIKNIGKSIKIKLKKHT